ncbi:hypothetical protein BDFB_009703 [Asbolus verrucosus]|uniref:Uncharacterized protein n=1 Tax=Asbolus verrucosus TaxID=1661398 RepID=A0A482VNV1_ASBVE|nr:hypothetical protein BDFB_009703 [Asbolus verrucosus]
MNCIIFRKQVLQGFCRTRTFKF